ncbi:MAG: hypothetical protein CL910_13535 [Deltaproteobacteria bacterium]|nr:hypothetical protein [Deltaproteobacteria bacterium]
MQLLLDRISEDPIELVFRGSPEWLAGLSPDPELAGAVREEVQFALRAHRMGEDLYLEGEATGSYELGCGRCLKRYRQPIREPFRLVLEPAGSRSPADPEGAAVLARDGLWLSDELEAGWFRGSEVQLDHFLQEVIAAGLPFKPLCREECAGLCPTCGVDRNVGSCDCREESPASPFSALAGLRDKLAKRPAGEGEER